MEEAERLYDYFDEQFDDSLRSVGYYDDGESDFRFVREDVESDYESGEKDRVIREVRLEALDQDHQESLYTHGELQATLRFFDNATEFHFALDETQGVVAAVDTGAVEGAREVIESATDAIDS